jgi:hypothetical protein
VLGHNRLSGAGLSGGKFLYSVRVLNDVESGADAGIRALAFAARAGILAAGDASGRVHFLKVDAA